MIKSEFKFQIIYIYIYIFIYQSLNDFIWSFFKGHLP